MLLFIASKLKSGFRVTEGALLFQILHDMYDKEIISEDAILRWASEKQYGDEGDKVYVKQSEKFIEV
jgi:hypothetical protein